MKVCVDSLVIEVTRKCNMTCAHCLRGDAQNVNIKIEYVDKLFSQINNIGSITFTGGEPQLVPGIIDKIRVCAANYGIDIGNFYTVTNGLVNSRKFLHVILDWWDYCSDNDISGVEMSNDVWHDNCAYVNEYEVQLNKLKFFNKRSWKGYDDSYIQEGRAINFKKGNKTTSDTFYIQEYDETLIINEGTLYLNARGQIISGCDWSYESQATREDIQIGSIKDNNFNLLEWAKTLPKEGQYER